MSIEADVFYSQNVFGLVAQGSSTSAGNLNRMLYSEVKVP